jgi:lipopolysaccharide exporter
MLSAEQNQNQRALFDPALASPQNTECDLPMIEVPALGQSLFSGTMWMFTMRWVVRLLSVISIATLARLLEKEEFGLVALASAVVALPTVLTDLGVEQALIAERDAEPGVYNTAWTIRAIQMAIAAAVVFAGAPLIAGFYGDPRIAPMTQVLSLVLLLKGFENIWTVSFRKELKFSRDFSYDVSCKVLAVAITIGLAFYYRSYWALVYGQVAAAALRVVISLFMAPEWPRATLSHWGRIWSYSQWSLAKGIASYAVQNGDRIILGRLAGAGAVGAYSIGREIAEMPLTEISMPVNRALGPAFSALQNDRYRLVQALTKSLAAVATIALPVGVGLALTAGQLIPVFLGNGWEEAVPVLQLLSLASIITAVRGVMGNTLAVIGYIRSSAIVMWVRGILLIATGIPAAIVGGATGMGVAFLVSEALTTCATLIFYRQHLPEFSMANLGQALFRPALSALAMSALVLMVDQIPSYSPFVLLISKLVVGVTSYGIIVYLLWHRSGYPEGLEGMIFERLRLMRRPG